MAPVSGWAQTNFDLSLSFGNFPGTVSLGQYFTCDLTVSTAGPDAAQNVVVTNRVPANLEFVSARSTRGTCTQSAGLVTWNVDPIGPYSSATVTLEFKATHLGSFTNLAGAWSALASDPTPTNNVAACGTAVTSARFFGVGRMNTNHVFPTSTLLTNGDVLVVGWYLTKQGERYNSLTRTFARTGDMLVPRGQQSAGLLRDGRAVVIGGYNRVEYGSQNTAEFFDPGTGLFRRAAGEMAFTRYSPQLSLLGDGRMLVCGGAGTNEVFDPVTETFSLAPTLGCPYNGILLSTGKYLYFGYGRAYLYDPATGTSVETSGFLQPREAQTATLLPGGKVLIAGGRGTWGATYDTLSSSETYDPVSNTFSPSANLTGKRQNHSAILLPDGTVLLSGGMKTSNDAIPLDTAEIYDASGTLNVPGVGVSDATFTEGNSGTNYLQFNVWLTAATAWPVTVQYATASGTAGSVEWNVGNNDFIPTNGVLTIPAGATNGIIYVPVRGDNIREPDETLTVSLSVPTQAWMSRALATGTILNDDPLPTVSISPASLAEGDSGLSNLNFSVTLSAQSLTAVSVDYFTTDQSAAAGSDYVQTTGTLTFNPGETNLIIGVPVIGGLVAESSETLLVTLTNPQEAVLGVSNAVGTILDDDGIAGRLHHFQWSAIPAVQYQSVPFPVTITAFDCYGAVVTSVPWPVRISAQTTNVVAGNLDFEQPTLAPWVSFNYTPYPKTFQQVLCDITGSGQPSTAVRTIAGGGTNGIAQDVWLAGGVPYTFSANFLTYMEGNDGSWYGAAAYIEAGFTNTVVGLGGGRQGSVTPSSGAVVFTPPTNGFYPLRLSIVRDYWYGDALAVYMDDVQISYPLLTPTVASNFVNGTWTGSVAALQSAANMALLADDNAGHKGLSNPFGVLGTADLGLSGSTNWASLVRTGDRLTINLSVTNRGPAGVSDAVVRCTLPPNVSFLSASNSLGAVTNASGMLSWATGSLPKGSNATASIALRADIPGTFTNAFVLTSSVLDLNTNDNALQFPAQVYPPLLNIADASAYETNGAATGMVFALTLSGPSAQLVSVSYLTVDGTATNGFDYVGTNGTVVFPPFETNATLRVFALDNILDQPNRAFSVQLTNELNAIISDGLAGGTVLDDDAPPTLSISNTSVVEGDSGTVNAVFPLSLSKPAVVDVSVRCTTSPGTADTNDYIHTVTTVVFPAGSTSASFAVPVRGNTVNEPDETFTVTLSIPVNATIATGTATGTILNDDAVPGRLDHFEFAPVSSPQYTNRPFQLTVRAVDYRGTNVSFSSSLPLQVQTDEFYLPLLVDDFEDGDLLGWTNYGGSLMVVSNVNDTAAGGFRSLRISGRASYSTYYYALRRAISNSRPNRISFSVRAAQTNAITGRMWPVGGAGYRAFDFYMNKDGRMGLYNPRDNKQFIGVPYISNRWYRVDLDLNWTTRLINGRVDTALVMTNLNFLDDPYSGTDYITLQNTENGISWFDDIQVANSVYSNLVVTPPVLSGFVNGVWTGNVTVALASSNAYFTVADTSEHVGRSALFNVLPLGLQLGIPLAVTEGDGNVSAQVSIPFSLPQPVTVTLTSSTPSKLLVPSSVTIAAGQTNAAFNLTVLNDSLLDGPQNVLISATASNVAPASAMVTVNDNESATLSLVMPATAVENAGALVNQGRVQSSAAPTRDITVSLASSDVASLQVPPAVVIPAGQTSATFTLAVIDNSRIDGTRVASVSATVPNWVGATNSIVITDNEDTLLRAVGPTLVSEGVGAVSYTVSISGTLPTNLVIQARSTAPERLSLPFTATMLVGQTSLVCTATIIDNSAYDGATNLTLTFSAPGFTPAGANVTVLDNEVHHFTLLTPLTGSRTSTVPFTVSVYARDILDNPVTAYNQPVTLAGVGSGKPIALSTSNIVLTAGQWTGSLALFTEETSVALRATDTNGVSGQSTYFTVVLPSLYLANVNAADLFSSAASGRLWALVATNSTLVPIDPVSDMMESGVPAGSGADRAVSSGDGRYAHIGRGQYISRFDTLARAIDLTWTNESGFYVEDFAAMPGNSDSVAVSWMQPGYSPRGRGSQIYDGGVPRIPGGFGAGNLIEFSESPTRLYGYNSETTGFEFALLKVGATNVALEKIVSLMHYFGANYTPVGKLIFAITGQVFDPERGVLVGGASVTPVTGDSVSGRFYKYEPTPGRLVTSDLETLLPISSMILPGVSNATGTMVRWGASGLAFRANAAQIAIVRSSTIPSGPPADLSLSVSAAGLPVLWSNTFLSDVTVYNAGPNPANNVVVAGLLPTNSSLVSASLSSGTSTQWVNALVCSLGNLGVGQSATARLTLMGHTPGLSLARMSVTSDSPDPTRTNNVISLSVSVGRPALPDRVTEIRQVTSDLAWNPARGRIYASVPNGQPLLGSSLVSFDPLTGAFDAPIPTGLEPNRLAVAANGQFVYAGLDAETSIQRVDAVNRVADLKFPTGFGNVSDMAVLQDNPHAVVATVHTTLVVYDDGVQRSNLVGATEYNQPYFLSLVSPAVCYSTYPTGFRRIRIDAGGATLLTDNRDTVVTYPDWDIEYGAGRMFTPGGRVFDPVAGTNITTVPYSGLVAPDETDGRVFYLTGSGSTWTVSALNITNFQLAGAVTITNVSGTPSRLLRWGSDGLAFRTSGGQIFVVRTTLADDRDQDGLPDAWELAQLGSLSYGPGDDPDHDGFTNLQECQGNLNPLVADIPRFLYARPRVDGSFELSMLGNPGPTYTLWASSNLVDWTYVQSFVCTNIPTVISDPAPPAAGPRYYRFSRPGN